MKNKAMLLKIVSVAVMTAAAATFAGCGSTDDSQKVYLNEIDAKDYVKLGEYKGLEITQADPEVTDETRDSYINYLLSMNPDRGVIEGDTVNIDYVGTLDGVAFDGGTASGSNLTIGSGQFIDGFEDGLIGAKVGDTVELNLTFPEGYQAAELAGKDVVFTVTINTIMSATPQELTDEYVKGLGIECSTVEEYQQYVYDMMYEEQLSAYDIQVENALASAAVEKSEFIKDPPQAMLDRYNEMLTSSLTSAAAAYGMTLEQYMQLYYGMDAATYPEEIKTEALNSAQRYILLQAIADAEGLNVTDEELRADIENTVAESSYESVDAFKEAVDEESYREYMMSEKVLGMMRENAVISAE